MITGDWRATVSVARASKQGRLRSRPSTVVHLHNSTGMPVLCDVVISTTLR